MRMNRENHNNSKKDAFTRSFLITGIYCILGSIWIIGSEILVSLSHTESSAVFWISIAKGLGYVLTTSILLFLLIFQSMRQILKESAVRERNEAVLNEAQRLAHIGSFEFDSRTKHLSVSREALHILEIDNSYAFDDIPSCFELVHPLDRVRVEEGVLSALAAQQNASFFFRIQVASGNIRNVHVRLILRYEAEDALIVLGTIQDNTDRILAENAAKDSETIFKTFINSSYDLIYLKDNNLCYLAVNSNMQQFYGLNEEALLGKTTREAVPFDGSANWEELDRHVLETGKPVYIEDESFDRTFETIIFPVDLADQKRGVGGVSRDITQRKQAEAAIEKERDRAQTYLDIAAIINIAMDRNGVVTLINKAGCDKLGLEKTEILGRNWIDSFIPEREREAVRAVLHQTYEGEFQSDQVNENGILTSSGEERRIEWRTAILRDENGTMYGVFSAGVDVTELRQAMQALRESERSKSVLLANLPGMAYRCVCDRHWTMQFVSGGCFELTGYQPEELLGNRRIAFNDIILPEYREPIWQESELHLSAREDNRYEYEILTATGERKWVLDINQGVFLPDGSIDALEGIIIDITESKRQFLQIQFLSSHDQLTGLHNRSYFEAERNRIHHENTCPVTVLHADINGLKLINDAFGSQLGDQIIQKTASLFEQSLRNGEILARIGGDEFALLMPGVDAKSITERIQEIQRNFDSYNQNIPDRALVINLSYGWGVKMTPEEDLAQIERDAETNLSRRKLFDQKSHHNAVLSSIMATLFERSFETEEHAERIGRLCTIIGERIGLTHENLDKLRLFAILHDIGKIGVSDQILNKPGPLNEEELTQMRKHPEIGYRIAMSSPEFATVAEYILAHHERWDGNGYPNRISGENIPLLARILALADAYDAMTKDRVYRKALPRDIVLNEIRNNAGSQFDPYITAAFLDVLENTNL